VDFIIYIGGPELDGLATPPNIRIVRDEGRSHSTIIFDSEVYCVTWHMGTCICIYSCDSMYSVLAAFVYSRTLFYFEL
jgi:hypothetical protein